MIITFEELGAIRKKYSDKRIVFGGGVYDLIHRGHTEGFTFRRSLGDVLVCGIVSDDRAEQRKRRPIRSQVDRAAVVDAFQNVDYTFIMPMPILDMSPTLQVIESLRPDIYVEYIKNQDRWHEEDRMRIASFYTELIFDTQSKRNSTTNIINQLNKLV